MTSTKPKKKREVPLINRLHIEAISALHAIVIVTLIAATITFAIDFRWPELIFALTILGNQLLPARACILTYLENIWRIKAGIRPIKGWISHYILREYRKERDKVMGNEVLHCGDIDDTIKEQLKEELTESTRPEILSEELNKT